jgi:hypothetical protein
MKAIGPSFSDELKAAGLLGLPFTWGADGVIQFNAAMTQAQIDAVNACHAAHNPLLPSADGTRCAAIDAAIGADATIQALKAMTNAQFDAWWTANITTPTLAVGLLKRLTLVIIRKVL